MTCAVVIQGLYKAMPLIYYVKPSIDLARPLIHKASNRQWKQFLEVLGPSPAGTLMKSSLKIDDKCFWNTLDQFPHIFVSLYEKSMRHAYGAY